MKKTCPVDVSPCYTARFTEYLWSDKNCKNIIRKVSKNSIFKTNDFCVTQGSEQSVTFSKLNWKCTFFKNLIIATMLTVSSQISFQHLFQIQTQRTIVKAFSCTSETKREEAETKVMSPRYEVVWPRGFHSTCTYAPVTLQIKPVANHQNVVIVSYCSKLLEVVGGIYTVATQFFTWLEGDWLSVGYKKLFIKPTGNQINL